MAINMAINMAKQKAMYYLSNKIFSQEREFPLVLMIKEYTITSV